MGIVRAVALASGEYLCRWGMAVGARDSPAVQWEMERVGGTGADFDWAAPISARIDCCVSDFVANAFPNGVASGREVILGIGNRPIIRAPFLRCRIAYPLIMHEYRSRRSPHASSSQADVVERRVCCCERIGDG